MKTKNLHSTKVCNRKIGFISLLFAACLSATVTSDARCTQVHEQASTQNKAKTPSVSVEAQRAHAEGQAKLQAKIPATIDPEAFAAIEETRKVLGFISKSDKKEALAALERATGKVNILIARNPKTALIPVRTETEIADTAPQDIQQIKDLKILARDALDKNRLADARVLLDALRSETRVRTLNLPLATYPIVLGRSAQLVDQGKNDEAATILRNALNTLVIVDGTTSLPMQELSAALKLASDSAQKHTDKDNVTASTLLVAASTALKRAEALGHVDVDTEKNFRKQIDEIDRKVKGKSVTASTFTELSEAISAFFKKNANTESKGQLGK